MFTKIRNEAPFHGLTTSNLMHVWLGEEDPNPGSMWELTKKIIDKSLTSYFAFTKEITVCNRCHSTFPGVVSQCKCGAGPSELVVQSRITGYYSTVGTVDPPREGGEAQARPEGCTLAALEVCGVQ